jgi:ABC-type polysaccharide/polyol phosphate transport system ATPase subunit
VTPSAVSARNLGKSYRADSSPWSRLLEALTRTSRHREFTALDGVSFDLPRGTGLGLVGENGAGKSTLLKILAGVTAPTRGTFSVAGRIASILELGSGFHPEFTGRQNIVLNAALLGLAADEVERRLPEIIAWSELGGFIDRPVKTYSTGMAMRLGFSIATSVEPDVLIIDEALSVGDGYFQKKCMDRLLSFIAHGGTLLFCSHAMYYVSAFCQQVLWLREGRVAAAGGAADVVREYETFLQSKTRAAAEASDRGTAPPEERSPAGPARITGARVVGGEREARGTGVVFRQGDPFAVEVDWTADRDDLQFHLGVGINRIDEVEVAAFASHHDGLPAWSGGRDHRALLRVPRLPLIKGDFTVYVFLLDEAGLHVHDRRILPEAFRVSGTDYRFGLVAIDHSWESAGHPATSSARAAQRPTLARG